MFDKTTQKMIVERVIQKLKEKNLDHFPTELSRWAYVAKQAKEITTSGVESSDGDATDDIIEVTPNSLFPVTELYPSQSSMNIRKALGFVISMIRGKMQAGGNLGAFISKDHFIMDGHHRWISTAMFDPSIEVGGFLVDMQGEFLLKILNAMTVGQFEKFQGKKASGGFEQFEPEEVRKALADFATNGIGGDFPVEQPVVLAALQDWTGQEGKLAVKAAANRIIKNLSGLTLDTPSWAPERPDMPIIDKEDVPVAVDSLDKGKIDWNDSKRSQQFRKASSPRDKK